ncbi:conjugal transfer protein TrbJ [Candidatus Magnetomorum sp. HK-1]|nr:conjugal transfer protein TrbJ [Candidatus Magnetomorum sp. HK-1]
MNVKQKLLALLFVLIPSHAAIANLPVMDIANLIQNVQNTLSVFELDLKSMQSLANQTKQLANDSQKIENQIRQIEYMVKNLKRLNLLLRDPNLSTVQKLNQMCYTTQGVGYGMKNTNSNYDEYIRNRLNPVSSIVLEKNQKKLIFETEKTNDNTLMLQEECIENIEMDVADVNAAMNRSRNAVGMMETLQVNNELLAQQIKQSMRTQQLLISRGNIDSSVLNEEQSEKFMKNLRHEYLMSNFKDQSTMKPLTELP